MFVQISWLNVSTFEMLCKSYVKVISKAVVDSEWLWQVGRIPNEWARCLLPLVRDKKVRVEGCCRSAPDVLGIMDTILLSIR